MRMEMNSHVIYVEFRPVMVNLVPEVALRALSLVAAVLVSGARMCVGQLIFTCAGAPET